MTEFAKVLQRKPGSNQWTQGDYPIGEKGFDLPSLQSMAGGGCFQTISLGEEFQLVCNEEGRLKGLPVSIALGIGDGRELPIFGAFAIVRRVAARSGDETDTLGGLLPGDGETILSSFMWLEGREQGGQAAPHS